MYNKKFTGNNPDGKSILIISGVHGDELTPIFTSHILSQTFLDKPINLNVANVKHITICNAVNTVGVEYHTRELPNTSTTDINRMLSNRPKSFELKQFKNLIDTHDVIIDLHSSPKCTEFLLINQNQYADSYVEFAKMLGMRYLVRYSATDTIKKYAIEQNKISLTLEMNGLNYIDFDSANRSADMIAVIIDNIDLFNLNIKEPTHPTYEEVYTHHNGIFVSNYTPGSIIGGSSYPIGNVIDMASGNKTEIFFNKDEKYNLIAFGTSDYVDANQAICIIQKI